MSTRRLLLLCTDLDRTLVPNGEQPESPEARPLFARVAAQPDVVLTYVTGRDKGRVEEAIARWSLPRPDLVVADVGTTIFDLRGGRWERVDRWDEVIAPDWAGSSHEDLAERLAEIDALELQEPSRQGTHKLSYTAALEADVQRIDGAVAARLDRIDVRAARVWSVDQVAGERLLDIVPASATKLHAVRFVAELLDITLKDTLFAGDSGNDVAALASEVPAVVVANALPQVVEAATRLARELGHNDALYVARGGWAGTNGNYAAGILEGLAHFHPERVRSWLAELNRRSSTDAGTRGGST